MLTSSHMRLTENQQIYVQLNAALDAYTPKVRDAVSSNDSRLLGRRALL
jgi:hypothetical protein